MQHRAGRYVAQPAGYRAFIPEPLPPRPPLEMQGLQAPLSQADRALGRLDGSVLTLPNPDLFVFMYIRKEAVLSSQTRNRRFRRLATHGNHAAQDRDNHAAGDRRGPPCWDDPAEGPVSIEFMDDRRGAWRRGDGVVSGFQERWGLPISLEMLGSDRLEFRSRRLRRYDQGSAEADSKPGSHKS